MNTLSLFCGAGGLDIGFKKAGFNLIDAFDNNHDACLTFERNIGKVTLCDLSNESFSNQISYNPDIIIGGPPCQGFSKGGRMKISDSRNKLIWNFASIVKNLNPKIFVMENVPNLFIHSKFAEIKEKLIEYFEEENFTIQEFLLNAKNFGVPQNRKRAILIGIQNDKVVWPNIKKYYSPIVTVREAISDLPNAGIFPNTGICTAKIVPCKNPVLRASAYTGMLFNGCGRPINLDSQCNTIIATIGGNRTPIIDIEALKDSSVKPWIETYYDFIVNNKNQNLFNDSIISTKLRRLTIKEAALIQTFPISFEFLGSKTSQFKQIGNAVPCNLSYGIAKYIKELLLQIE